MRIQPVLALALCSLLELFLFFNFTISYDFYDKLDDSPILHTYRRLSEIEKHCSSYLSSASDLKNDHNRIYRLKNELSFRNGEWYQETGQSPLKIPLEDRDVELRNISLINPFKLANFQVTDVNPVRQFENRISLIGVLSLGITRRNSFSFDLKHRFHMEPDLSILSVVFEGVYVESKENRGKRLLCLMGDTTLPSGKWSADNSDLKKGYWSSYNPLPEVFPDDQILLVLRYPQTFSLTRRAIRGEMISLHTKESVNHFDRVHILSQLDRHSKYQFSTEMLKSITCDNYVHQEELLEDGVTKYNSELCENLEKVSELAFDVMPNWRLKGRHGNNGKFGPFLTGKEIEAADSIKLVMQQIMCEQENGSGVAEVAIVFRAIPALIDHHMAASRTSLSSMTLSAEGKWDPSKGQLCMIGCLGDEDSGLGKCDSQISFYFPRAFSIKQRSAIYGSISSLHGEKDSYNPIMFDAVTRPGMQRFSDFRYVNPYLIYNYSKIKLAESFMQRNQRSKLGTFLRRSFLTYPNLEDGQRDVISDGSSFGFQIEGMAVPDSISDDQVDSKTSVEVTLLSWGPSVVAYGPWMNNYGSVLPAQSELSKSEHKNVSMHLVFAKEPYTPSITTYKNVSELFLEGVYDQLVGEMYLIGCRKVSVESIDLERGLDCQIEVKIEYPSVTTRWLVNPTSKISIKSKRDINDPLYFSPVCLRTHAVGSEQHEKDFIFRKIFEGVLQILILLVANALILTQRFYLKKRGNFVRYTSLVMLALQSLGYSLPLISGADIFFWKQCESEKYIYYERQYQLSFKALGYTAKALSLAALLLTSKIFQKVIASRNKPHGRGLMAMSKRAPSEKRVFLIVLIVHSFGFLLLILVKGVVVQSKVYMETNNAENIHEQRIWTTTVEEYMDVAQDLFLLPQIVGNILWQNHVKSLSKFYYIGFTLLRLVLRLYDFVRNSVFEELHVVAMIALAIVLHMQQTRKYQKLSHYLNSRTSMVKPFKSTLQEKFLAKSPDA